MVYLSKNSLFEVCSTVPLDINGSLAGILDFGEDIVSKAAAIRVVFLRTMVARTTRTVIVIRNPRSHQQFLHPSTEKGCSYTLFVGARLAQLVRSLTANQKVPGLSPGLVEG